MKPASANPLVSVIMPLYNAERFVGESIDSVLAQSIPAFELIVIDDCSTDASVQIVEEFMARDPRITLLRNERNLGAARTRNRGLDAARGQFIAFLDAADICLPERFEKQLSFFEANPRVDICGSFYAIFDNDRGRESARCCELPTSPDEIRYKIFFIDPLGMSTVMLRSEALRRTGIRFRECLSEDYQLWADLSDRLVMANIPECLIHYRRWENQTSSRKLEALIDCAAGVQRDLLDRRLGIRLTDDQARIFARFTYRPETLQRSDLPFFRQLSIRFYRAYRLREPHTPSHLKRFLLGQYLAHFRRFHPSWRTRIEKRLFRLALLIG